MEPKFHDDAGNLDQLVPFEECIQLRSTAEAVVRPPEYLLLTHNGREFKLVSRALYLPLVFGIMCSRLYNVLDSLYLFICFLFSEEMCKLFFLLAT